MVVAAVISIWGPDSSGEKTTIFSGTRRLDQRHPRICREAADQMRPIKEPISAEAAGRGRVGVFEALQAIWHYPSIRYSSVGELVHSFPPGATVGPWP
jgi:hypothetical protein